MLILCGCGRFRDVASLLSAHQFNSSMRRAARANRPEGVHSVEGFVEALEAQPALRNNAVGQPLYLGNITVGEYIHVVFGSEAVLTAINNQRPLELHMDAAMKTVPRLFKQLFVVTVVGGDSVSTLDRIE